MAELTLTPQSLLLQGCKGLELVSPAPTEGGELSLRVSGNGSNNALPVSIENGGDVSTEWSADGSRLAISCVEGTYLLRSNEKGEFDVNGVVRLPPPRPKAMHWSPKGTFLATWASPELVVWEGKTGEVVLRLPQKVFRSSQWPSIQDEVVTVRATADSVLLMDGKAFESSSHIGRVSVPSLSSFCLGPGLSPAGLGCFVPEKKGHPSRISLYALPVTDVPVASKSCFRAEEASFRWSPDGKAVIVLTSADMDATGQSYYGSTGLYLMHTDGSLDMAIHPSKEGPVHDVQWGGGAHRRFAVCSGTMPSQTVLYNFRGEPIFQFGELHRNTLAWNSQGRFLCIAGFGNLQGDMDFWDVNKELKLGSCKTDCAIDYGWSPDGRSFMTSTCAPRMNVDNGMRIYKYNGEGPLLDISMEKLYHAGWRPASKDSYPDRPASPRRKRDKSEGKNSSAGTTSLDKKSEVGGSTVQRNAKTNSTAVYRPPGARTMGDGGVGGVAAMMRAERAGAAAPGKISRTSGFYSGREPYIPGLPPVAGGMSKSAKKKGKKKKAAAAAEAKVKLDSESQVVADATAIATPSPDPEKRHKQLVKKMRAIDSIKAKKAEGKSLNDDELVKLDSEDALRKELEALKLG